MNATVIWFRRDLRLADNPALEAAVRRGGPIIPLYIWSPQEDGAWPPGAASKWWLHQSLKSLDGDLRTRGLRLILRSGPSLAVLRELLRLSKADSVFWNRCYEPAVRRRDAEVEAALERDGIRVGTFNSALLLEPSEIRNSSGGPFRVFTPFWNAYLKRQDTFDAVGTISPPDTMIAPRRWPKSLSLSTLDLEPKVDWTKGFRTVWQPGEAGAVRLIRSFLSDSVARYPEHRDRPDVCGTSRLSPHLHFGEISPRQIWRETRQRRLSQSALAYLRQLVWREFAHHLLWHFPHTPEMPLRPEFRRLPWRKNRRLLRTWQQGRTGYPLVDAGMRELWATGWMHNRVRMVAASFLVKDLLIPWQEGARWFWDTLVDADLANNTLGWQWVAGCGADAAPFFRVFNPNTQSSRFDPNMDYIRRWVPEFGTDKYAAPIINHSTARRLALEAFASLKK